MKSLPGYSLKQRETLGGDICVSLCGKDLIMETLKLVNWIIAVIFFVCYAYQFVYILLYGGRHYTVGFVIFLLYSAPS